MSKPAVDFYEFDGFRLDARKRLLQRAGEVLSLTPKAFDTLLVLLESGGRVIEKDELMQAVWPDTIVEESALARNIYLLRKTLGESPEEHRFIVTVRAQSSDTASDTMQQTQGVVGGGLLDAVEQAKQAQIKAFTGSWEGVITPEEGGPPPFRILFTFGADGTVVASDAGPPSPQLAATEHGVWERTGDNEFTIIYKQLLFDAAGNLDSTFKGRIKFKLNPNTLEISGLVKVNIYTPTGETIIEGAGTIKCTKIRVEPLN